MINMHCCQILWRFCEASDVNCRASLYTVEQSYTGTYTGNTLCPGEGDEQSTELHEGARGCPWWGWAHGKGAEVTGTLGWSPLPLGLASLVLVGDQRGKNTMQIPGARGSTLPCPCQRQATGCSNPIEIKLSEGHAESWLLRPKGLGLRAPGDLRFPTGFLAPLLQGETRNTKQLTACPGCRVSLPFFVLLGFFFTSYLQRDQQKFLDRKLRKGVRGLQSFSAFRQKEQRVAWQRCELLHQSSFSWRNTPGDEAARNPSPMGCLHPGMDVD